VSGIWLNLGCGPRPLEGFVNVDLLETPGVDVVADVGGELPFRDGEVELIYASHVLEHLATARVPIVLREWRRVLRDGGQLLVAVPDLDRIARLLNSRAGWFTPPHEPWVGVVYGGQKDELDFHKTGFTAPSLAALLDGVGFGAVERVERFTEIGANDGSWSPLPFGVNISLNMRAMAGAERLAPELFAREPFNVLFDVVDSTLTFALRASALLRARLMQRRRRRLEDALGASARRSA
jgi:SAM-dependent methyltransferase